MGVFNLPPTTNWSGVESMLRQVGLDAKADLLPYLQRGEMPPKAMLDKAKVRMVQFQSDGSVLVNADAF